MKKYIFLGDIREEVYIAVIVDLIYNQKLQISTLVQCASYT